MERSSIHRLIKFLVFDARGDLRADEGDRGKDEKLDEQVHEISPTRDGDDQPAAQAASA